MPTLYISDLDGTLLDDTAHLSSFTAQSITKLVNDGMLFSVATARSPATIVQLLKDIPLKSPIVALTGAVVFDPNTNTYPVINAIENDKISLLCDILNKKGLSAFIQTITDNHIKVYYKKLTTDFEKLFVKRRTDTEFKSFYQTEDYSLALQTNNAVLLTIMNTFDVVSELSQEFGKIDGITTICYKEEYGSENYYLEVFAKNVSKANAIKQLLAIVKADKLTSFGDNINDIPMFEISDECYATENAIGEVKAIATAVINANYQNGVAKWLLENAVY